MRTPARYRLGRILIARSRCLTPPLDEDEETELSKSLELDARLALERDGCPPCYPSGLDLAQQTHLQTNLKRMEQFEKRRDRLKKELSGLIKAEDMETVLNELEIAERDLERHKVLLIWIEEERRTMAA